MSWKAVELQVAIPRTQDLGQLQEQLQQRGFVSQSLMRQRAEILRLHRQRATTASEKNQFSAATEAQKNNRSQRKYKHPDKGNLIDFSG